MQYSMAPGTAMAQKRLGGKGVRRRAGRRRGHGRGRLRHLPGVELAPGNELPILIIVTNNQYGISTPASEQHGERHIANGGHASGMKTATMTGNNPELSYRALAGAMAYVRTQRRPFLLEVMVSRLYGHSSSSGANLNHRGGRLPVSLRDPPGRAGHPHPLHHG